MMIDALPELIVLAIGGSVAPPLLLLSILSLGSHRPLPNATALALGYLTTGMTIGIMGLTFFGGAGEAISSVEGIFSVTLGGLLIVLGLRSLLHAPDPDASPPRWMESIRTVSPARAFVFGMALFPIQIKNLAIFVVCLGLIAVASLSPLGSVLALGLVLLIFLIPTLVLIGLYATAPQQASKMLGSLQGWMDRNSRAITVVLCFVFAAFFPVIGLAGP